MLHHQGCYDFDTAPGFYRLLSAIEYTKEFYLKVPIGCDDAYRHHPAFDGKFVEIIAAKQILKKR